MRLAGLTFLGLCLSGPAFGGSLADSLSAEPPTFDVAGWEARISGFAQGSLFDASESGGPALHGGFDDTDVTGQARVNVRLQRTLDSGFTFGARTVIEAYHDELSGDRYGSDTFEKLYVYMQTAFGTVEVGQVDGAGARLGVTGPKVDDHVSLDDPETSFFTNPDTGHRIDGAFYPFSAASTSENFGKINFISTRILGLQLGLSFTPQDEKSPFPFGGNPADGPNQNFLWETALSYTGFITDNLAITASAAYTGGTLQPAVPGMDDLHDWAFGAQAQYVVDEVKLSFGGAYRESNAYGFHEDIVLDGGETKLAHLSAMIEWDVWRLGAEYSHADIDGPHGFADVTMDGYQVAGGYRFNDNIQITAGWQWRNYDRDTGAFFNGLDTADMNAGFVTLGYTL